MFKKIFYLIFIISPILSWTEEVKELSQGIFSARVSKINHEGQLLRLRVDFPNLKYLGKNDGVEFWSEGRKDKRCASYVVGKSQNYLLLKVPHFNICIQKVSMTVGTHFLLYSEDLLKNLKKGQEVVELLSKKRLALKAKMNHSEKELASYIEKLDAVNARYTVLKAKLLKEWQEELAALEHDRGTVKLSLNNLEAQLGEIDHKVEQYKVFDSNLEEDRWALDSLYYHKK